MRLIPHPDMPSRFISGIALDLCRVDSNLLELRFLVSGDFAELKLPDIAPQERKDGLWQATCFELFLAHAAGYDEFNFSPSSSWAAYSFSGYREGMKHLADTIPPEIDQDAGASWYEFEVRTRIPCVAKEVPVKVGVSAVIEEKSGNKSYWALAHPPGKPDFHHPDCFVLELPAADAT